MKRTEPGVKVRGCARRGSPRSDAPGFEMTRANALSHSVCQRGTTVAMQTSMSTVMPPNDLSFLLASTSEALDNGRGLQYGLELVIPMSSRWLETR
jgi:hypothetical protein